jgi:hypothetical protein
MPSGPEASVEQDLRNWSNPRDTAITGCCKLYLRGLDAMGRLIPAGRTPEGTNG